jgi:hypothetical protein
VSGFGGANDQDDTMPSVGLGNCLNGCLRSIGFNVSATRQFEVSIVISLSPSRLDDHQRSIELPSRAASSSPAVAKS